VLLQQQQLLLLRQLQQQQVLLLLLAAVILHAQSYRSLLEYGLSPTLPHRCLCYYNNNNYYYYYYYYDWQRPCYLLLSFTTHSKFFLCGKSAVKILFKVAKIARSGRLYLSDSSLVSILMNPAQLMKTFGPMRTCGNVTS